MGGERLALTFPLLVAALLAALTFWLDQLVQSGAEQTRAISREPDFVVHDLSATQTGEDGRPRHVLKASRMTHYPADDSTLLEQPRLSHFRDSRMEVQARAEQATVSGDGRTLQMSGGVLLVRGAYAGQGELTLRTEQLTVLPEQGRAHTGAPVTLTSPTSRTDAVGLEFDYDRRQLTLLSNVRVSIRPR